MVTLTELLYRNSHDTGEGVVFDWEHWNIFKEGLREILEGCWNEAIESRNDNECWGNVDWNEIKKDKQKYLNDTTRF